MNELDIAGLCGSLRAGSLNRMALKLAGEMMPEGMNLDPVEIRDIPMFDGDILGSHNAFRSPGAASIFR